MHKMQVRSLCWEDPLGKGMTTHSDSLAWRIPWTEEPGGLQSMGLQRVRHDWSNLARTCTHEKRGCSIVRLLWKQQHQEHVCSQARVSFIPTLSTMPRTQYIFHYSFLNLELRIVRWLRPKLFIYFCTFLYLIILLKEKVTEWHHLRCY